MKCKECNSVFCDCASLPKWDKEEPKDGLKNLGCMNGWREAPEEVKKCEHNLDINNIGSCLTRYTCKPCGYSYTVDSSG